MKELSQLLEQNVSDVRFVAFDTETTGGAPHRDHLVELAALTFDEDFEHRNFESLVRPPVEIPGDVIRIHGIDDSMVRSAPDAPTVLERFYDFLNWSGTPRILIAHNAAFDLGMIHSEFNRISAKAIQNRFKNRPPEIIIDSCMLAKRLLPERKTHRLEALAQFFECDEARFHRAVEDVRVLSKVFLNLLSLSADQPLSGRSGSSPFLLKHLIDLVGGFYVLDLKKNLPIKKSFHLPPKLELLNEACETQKTVGILYHSQNTKRFEESDGEFRYIVPHEIKLKGFIVYIEALCLRDDVVKSFRADRIEKVEVKK